MPNRMLRDWTQSDKVNMLSVHAERFFVRLIMKVDDYGCFYADLRLVKANLFPLLIDNIREADLSRWMAECQKAGLIVLYESNQKKYLQIIDFKQRLDRAKSKFPLPDVNQPVNDPPEVVNDFPPEVEKKKEEEGKYSNPIFNSNLYRQPNIPTEEKVIMCFRQNGGTDEMAKKFIAKHSATGWFTQSGPIVNFTSLVPGFIEAWNKNNRPKNDTKQMVL